MAEAKLRVGIAGVGPAGTGIMSCLRILVLASLALTLAGPAAAQDAAEWSKVIEAAKQEGKVVVYNAAIGASYYLAVVKSFAQIIPSGLRRSMSVRTASVPRGSMRQIKSGVQSVWLFNIASR